MFDLIFGFFGSLFSAIFLSILERKDIETDHNKQSNVY